jgi:exodeoxyribonuclease VII large subunit
MLRHRIGRSRDSLDGSAKLLASLSYHSVLRRGYALVRDGAGRTVRSASSVAVGDRLSIEVSDGAFAAEALGAAEPVQRNGSDDVSGSRKPKTRTPGPGQTGGAQGSLF